MATILVADDDPLIRDLLSRALAQHHVLTASGPHEAWPLLRDQAPDVLVTDVEMPGGGGLRLAEEALRLDPRLVVVVASGRGTLADLLGFKRIGATDYVLKPFTAAAVQRAVEHALDVRAMREEIRRLGEATGEPATFAELIGESEPMRELKERIARTAPTSATVLVTGRSGTGKELVARALHAMSARADGPFVAVHAGALSPHLVEAELFGHARGAFTGAERARLGRFEEAEGGTLFLDEIGTMDQATQVRLLRVVAEREFTRVGEDKPRPLDVRIMSATNVDLLEAVQAGRFRQDLYYRLSVVPLRLPDLAERGADIELLAQRLLEGRCARAGVVAPAWSPEALARLRAHPWPGNVRELENVIERALIVAGRACVLLPEHVLLGRGGERARHSHELPDAGLDLPAHLADVERALITQAMERSSGNRKRAADLLGLQRTTLVDKMRRLGLPAREAS